MRNVLADLAVEAEAATILAMRMAGATDNALRGDAREVLLRRTGLAAGKYWSASAPPRTPRRRWNVWAATAMSRSRHAAAVPRGAADGHLGRLRQRQRAGHVARHGNPAGMHRRAVRRAAKTAGQDPQLDDHVEKLKPQLGDLDTVQYRARKIAEDISLALQGSLLVRHGHPAVAEAFLATRLGREWGGAFGTLPTGLDLAPILERALVKG